MTYTVRSSNIKGAVVSGFMCLNKSIDDPSRASALSDSIIVNADVEVTLMEPELCRSLLMDMIEERLRELPEELQGTLQQKLIVYSTLNVMTYHTHVRDGKVMSSYLFEELKELATFISKCWQSYQASAYPDKLLALTKSYRGRLDI